MKRDFIALEHVKPAELQGLLDLAIALKADWKAGHRDPLLPGCTLAMVFQKPSLRTRTSFDIGMYQLGGHAVYLSPEEIQLGHRESIADGACSQSLLGRHHGTRFAHSDVVDLARYASVPVINGLSDYDHPARASPIC